MEGGQIKTWFLSSPPGPEGRGGEGPFISHATGGKEPIEEVFLRVPSALAGEPGSGPDVGSGGLIRPMNCIGTERSFFPEDGLRN